MIVPARRVILGAACAAMGVSCGGGRSDMATETANTADPLGATAADAACEGTIALGLPGNPMTTTRTTVTPPMQMRGAGRGACVLFKELKTS
jgi:hypothetical protein